MWCVELIPNSCSQGFPRNCKTKNLVCDSSLRTPQPLQTAQVITFYFVKTKLQMNTQMTMQKDIKVQYFKK